VTPRGCLQPLCRWVGTSPGTRRYNSPRCCHHLRLTTSLKEQAPPGAGADARTGIRFSRWNCAHALGDERAGDITLHRRRAPPLYIVCGSTTGRGAAFPFICRGLDLRHLLHRAADGDILTCPAFRCCFAQALRKTVHLHAAHRTRLIQLVGIANV